MKTYFSAVAGSGKTTMLIDEALKVTSGRVLLTTYTDENEEVIRSKFFEFPGYIPENVTIKTWFSFLLQHGVRPYSNFAMKEKVTDIHFVEGQSRSIKDKSGKWVGLHRENKFLDSTGKVYTDVLAELVMYCNQKSQGLVLRRIAKVFSHVFIDESQDLAGYDLEVVRGLLENCENVLIVGDPRQRTYKTNHGKKHSKYSKGDLTEFIETECRKTACSVDRSRLMKSHRSNQPACDLASALYPDMDKLVSANVEVTAHDGVFMALPEDCNTYLEMFSPTQLRYRVTTTTNDNYPSINFGKSKGKTFDRVIIYPTKDMKLWLINGSVELAPDTRARFYVALTRARFSTCIIVDKKTMEKISQSSRFEIRKFDHLQEAD